MSQHGNSIPVLPEFKGRFLRSKAGFTLFELLVAITILAVISTMVYSVLHVGTRFVEKGEKKIAAIAKEQGFLGLMHKQVSAAYFMKMQRRVDISSNESVLRIVTRNPLINRFAGIVIAFYRFDENENKLYYLEKIDYYNPDYNEEYIPSLDEMFLLLESPEPITMEYVEEDMLVRVEYGDKIYEFTPRSVARNI